jgi:hypothetical protein
MQSMQSMPPLLLCLEQSLLLKRFNRSLLNNLFIKAGISFGFFMMDAGIILFDPFPIQS